VVEEVLNELHSGAFFSNLNLRSSSHHVLMHPGNVEKTAFRTHGDLFEFLMMAFGLTNMSATFQALMNDMLRPFLCWYVLGFFNDNLIYNSSWLEHLYHVCLILAKLQEHKLFVKQSKCIFGSWSVSYMGHVICEVGMAMDE
jgi:hypothetical protein